MEAKVAIIGSGNIGWAIRKLLKDDYEVKSGDLRDGMNANSKSQVKEFLKDQSAVIINECDINIFKEKDKKVINKK